MSRILNMTSLVIFAVAILIGAASAQSSYPASGSSSAPQTTAKASAGTSSSDATFLKKAAAGGMAEVELGQLAVEKGSSDDVKKFGQRMVDDHSKANDKLKQVAAEEHVTLPQGLNAKDTATKANLEKLSGNQFDQAYMDDMVRDHKKDVAEFEKESQSAHSPAVKNFAMETLPTLQDHLKQAKSIAPSQTSKANPGQ